MKPIHWIQCKSRTWWFVFTQSVFNRQYYQSLPEVPLSFSIKFISVFFVLYMVFWSIVVAVVISAWLPPQVEKTLPRLQKQIVSSYPTGGVFRIQDNTLSTNLKSPYTLRMPTDGETGRQAGSFDRTNLLVIDERSKSGDYLQKDTIVLVTNKEVVVPAQSQPDTAYEVFQLSSFFDKESQPITITQSSFERSVRGAVEYITSHAWSFYPWIILFVAFMLVVFGSVAILLYHLMLFFLLGLLVYLISKMNTAMTYRRSYQFAIHAFVTPFLVDGLLKRVAGDMYSPLYFMALFALWTLYIMTPHRATSRVS